MIGGGIHFNIIKLPITRSIEVRFLDNLDNDQIFVGAMHNIFIGKVLKKVGQTNTNAAPITTQFEVEILDNIKGELSGKMVISQEGGYDNGIFTTIEGQALLTAGSTYILSARTDGTSHYLISSFPRGKILLSQNPFITGDELQTVIASNKDVQSLKDAYIHEQPLKIDVENGYDYNKYEPVPVQ